MSNECLVYNLFQLRQSADVNLYCRIACLEIKCYLLFLMLSIPYFSAEIKSRTENTENGCSGWRAPGSC